MIHQGGQQNPLASPYNGCVGIDGPIVNIVNNLDPAVDVVISGHTHQPYNCVIDNKIVTSAFSFGPASVTKVDLTIDRHTRDVVSMTADNRIVTRDVPKDSPADGPNREVQCHRRCRLRIGSSVPITADITRTPTQPVNWHWASVIADGQLDATNDPGFGDVRSSPS